jgi:hypothetical protein
MVADVNCCNANSRIVRQQEQAKDSPIKAKEMKTLE